MGNLSVCVIVVWMMDGRLGEQTDGWIDGGIIGGGMDGWRNGKRERGRREKEWRYCC